MNIIEMGYADIVSLLLSSVFQTLYKFHLLTFSFELHKAF